MRIIPLIPIVALICTSPVAAKTIVVNGPATSLQDAIDAAAPGDQLLLRGAFLGTAVVDKPLKIKGPVPIDGGCAATEVIRVTSNDVQLSKLGIYGGSHAGIDIENVTNVSVTKSGLLSAPFAGGCGDGQYGIDIVNSTNVKVHNVQSAYSGAGIGYTGAFVHLDAIPAEAKVRLTRLFTNYAANAQDVLIENSGSASSTKPAIIVKGSLLVSDHSGIVVRNSASVEIKSNYIGGHNWDAPVAGDAGLVLDAATTLNLIVGNKFYLNAPDILDQGMGNLIGHNKFIPPIPVH